MKLNNIFPAVLLILSIGLVSCDNDFEEINTNPTESTDLDPVYQFSKAQQESAIPAYHYQGEIIQQINTPFGGVLEGGNHNRVNSVNIDPTFEDLYSGPIREVTDVINKIQENPERKNLYNMARIWRAYCFQYLVDTYGDVPYTSAGLGFIEEEFFPVYDDQRDIYEDILNEYQEAVDQLDSQGETVKGDLFFDGDISQWKKLGNSLLLRAGMRYTEIDQAKAQSIVQVAVDPSRGGVMTSNDDNAVIHFNEIFTNATSSMLIGGERANYYVGKPFVDFLQSTNDPRLEHIAVIYEFPSQPLADVGNENTNPNDQIGMPYGYDENSVEDAPGFPGTNGTAFNYSQFNRRSVSRIDAPEYLVTYAQTQLLLAEASYRGFISGSAKEFYEAGIRGHMEQTLLYGEGVEISPVQQEVYLQESEVAFDSSNALEQINVQYWVASFHIWGEAWANFRRSGYPDLDPINFPGEDPSVAGDFIRRFTYPVREHSVNTSNVTAAAERMGGDNLGVHIFWDE